MDAIQPFFKNNNDSNGLHEAFFKFASIGIVVTDLEGEISAVNSCALKQFGYKDNELIGNKIEMLIPARVRDKHVQHRHQFEKEQNNYPAGTGMCMFGLKKDGTEFPADISFGKYFINSNHFIVSFISDISSRMDAETKILKLNNELESIVLKRTADLQLALHQLKEVNKKLETAIDFQKGILVNAGAIIISTDSNGLIKTYNPEAEKELGYSAAEIIGKHTPLLFHDKAEVTNKAIVLTKQLKQEVQAGMEVFFAKALLGLFNEYEWTYINKNGDRFPVLLNVTALKNEQQEVTGYLGVALNISESKKIQDELQRSLDKEKELGELKSRFVSMASHEFRTPLSTVLSSAYLIEKYTTSEDQPKREKHLQRIVSSVTMLTDILNDFLSLGKMEEGKILVKPVPLNIQDVATTVISELKLNLKKGQSIVYHHTGKTEVEMDISLLKHIIINLVSNASKFSPEASVIEVNTVCKSQLVVLSVKDHGIGISLEDQKHLMERFFRGTNAANIQGTGLGLHIVSKYTELMNGSIKCISELEKGTEFILTFKVNKE